jgi:hypothetical protein
MPKRRFFRFGYYTPETKAGRGLRLHQLRDGDAFIELAAVLHEYGHEYGKLILNFPAPSAAPTTPVDTSFLTASDLLVLTTRPPLHDAVRQLKHPIRRSHTSLEDCVLTAFAAYFEVCARDQVKLAGPLAARLAADVADRSVIEFTMKSSARYSRLRKYADFERWQKAPPARTSAYLIYTPPLWKDGPPLLATFGIGGPESLLWAYLLRTRFRDYVALDTPRFVMAEMHCQALPSSLHTLSFADDWHVDILLDIPVPTIP